MTSGIVLGISLCFDNHPPEQTAVVLAFHQPAAHQIRSDDFRRAAEERLGQSWEFLGDGLGGSRSGCLDIKAKADRT